MHHLLYAYALKHQLYEPGFADRPVGYQMVIDLKGKWLSGQRVGSGTESHVTLRAPMPSGRTSGTAVSAVVESGACYFGWLENPTSTTPTKVAKDRQRGLQLQGTFLDHTDQMTQETKHPFAMALRRFLGDLANGRYGDPQAAAIKCLGWQSEKSPTGREWVTVLVRDADNALRVIYEDPIIRDWIVNHRPIQSGGTGGKRIRCMITGEPGALCKTHPPIRGMPGATGGRSAHSSNNKPAFCSFGAEQGENAPSSQDGAEGSSAGLNHLVERVGVPFKRNDGTIGIHYKPRGGVYLGDQVFLIWTKDPHTEMAVRGAMTALIMGPSINPVETFLRIESADEASVRDLLSVEADEKVVEELIGIYRTGRVMPLFNEDYFHSFLCSDNGRLIPRNTVSGTIRELRRRIQQYVDDMRLPIPDNHRPRPLSQILAALCARADERFPPSILDGMLRCILQGDRVPMRLATAALNRCNAYPGDKDGRKQWRRLLPVRCSLLKLDLIRRGIPVTIYADPFKDLINTPIPTVIGYVMAEADYVQGIAIGDPQRSSLSRTTIVQSPYYVLPGVLTKYSKHIKKLRNKRKGMTVLSQKRLDQLVTRLGVQGPLTETGEATLSPAQIPQWFTPEDQAQFWLGFSGYRSWLWEEYRKRQAARARAQEIADDGNDDEEDDEEDDAND